MTDYPAISGITDASQTRMALVQNKQIVHAPLLGLPIQPLDADLTSWAAITRASGFDTFVATPTSANLAALVTNESGADQLLFGTPWVAYTPTFTGFGTASSISIWSKRIGDTLHIRGKFTSGTATAVEARMTLGFNGTNANVTSDATKVASIQMAGPAVVSLVAAWSLYSLIESNIGYITFGAQTSTVAGLTKQNGNGIAVNGTVMSVMAEVPISGW